MGLFGPSKVNINSISIPHFDLEVAKDDKAMKQWLNSEKSLSLSINFFKSVPDIPTIKDMELLRAFYRKTILEVNGGLIQVDVVDVKGFAVVKTIFKIPHQTSGTVYLASLTIPFKKHSYVVKVQTLEPNATGIRSSVVADKLLKRPKISIGSKSGGMGEWSKDPYHVGFKDGTLMNKSEELVYDKDFPNDALTIARSKMQKIENEIGFEESLRKLSSFDF